MTRKVLPMMTAVVLLLGIAHLGLPAFAPGGWRTDHLWFAGTGLAVIVTGLFNLAMMRNATIDRIQKAAWLVVNVATGVFFALSWTSVKEPQIVVGVAACLLLALCVLARPASGTTARM